MTFQEDYSRCLRAYCREAVGVNTEGLRDELYRACVLLSQDDTELWETANQVVERAPYGPCLYSGVPAAQLLACHGDKLTPRDREALTEFLASNCPKWRAELERGRYDSYRLLAAASLIGTGCLTGHRELIAAGTQGIGEMWDHVWEYDLPDEFLSPFYTALQLSSLALLRLLPVEAPLGKLAAELEDFIWRGVLRHFIPGTPQLVGPYSRAYTTGLCGYFQADMAALYRLLGEEAGFSLTGTLWDGGYSGRILPHGSLEGMRLYALYFAAFPYACTPETLAGWRGRTLPCALDERVHTPPSGDQGIKRRDEAPAAPQYPGGEVHIRARLEDGLAVAWADREYENGMACNSFSLLYRGGGGEVKTCFTKLAQDGRYIGQWNEYPSLGLRLNECNFPDDGRKTVRETADGLLVSYRPRALCRGAKTLRLGILFPAHFSQPDGVWIDGERVAEYDGTEYRGVNEIVVKDGGFRFTFRPQGGGGVWRVLLKNQFLNVEWAREAAGLEDLRWEFLFSWERKEGTAHDGGGSALPGRV